MSRGCPSTKPGVRVPPKPIRVSMNDGFAPLRVAWRRCRPIRNLPSQVQGSPSLGASPRVSAARLAKGGRYRNGGFGAHDGKKRTFLRL